MVYKTAISKERGFCTHFFVKLLTASDFMSFLGLDGMVAFNISVGFPLNVRADSHSSETKQV